MTFFRTRRAAGFTLIELMIVVSIVAVLATVAAVAMGRNARRVRVDQMTLFMGSYANAQEYDPYVNAGLNFCPPPATIGNTAVAWDTSCDTTFWANLSIEPNSTWFSYYGTGGDSADACTAPTPPTGVPSDLSGLCTSLYNATGAAPGDPVGVDDWWVIAAVADQDGDGDYSLHFTTSEMFPDVFGADPYE